MGVQSGFQENLKRICLTGGPCAGKTTFISVIQKDLA